MNWKTRTTTISNESLRFAVEEAGTVEFAFERMDEATVEAPTRPQWECARGCDHCCHLLVEVTESEVNALLPLVTDAIRERIGATAARSSGLDAGQYRLAGIRCAFLDEHGDCLVYDHRPLRCRAHVSTSVATCERVRAGDLPGGAVPGDGWLATSAAACQHGLGAEVRELHTAISVRDR